MKAEILEAIIRFSDHAHGEQKRKYADERYIVHPIRVMQTCQQYSHDMPLLSAALLHDVLEDTPVTRAMIHNFLLTQLNEQETERTIVLVVELTDVFIPRDYPRLNRKARKEEEANRLSNVSAEAQTIKYADIMDNAVDVTFHDKDFGYIYLKEAKSILEKMTKGNPILYERAIHTVRQCMEKVHKIDV